MADGPFISDHTSNSVFTESILYYTKTFNYTQNNIIWMIVFVIHKEAGLINTVVLLFLCIM